MPTLDELRRNVLLKKIDYLRAEMEWIEASTVEGRQVAELKELMLADMRSAIETAGQELGGRHPQMEHRSGRPELNASIGRAVDSDGFEDSEATEGEAGC